MFRTGDRLQACRSLVLGGGAPADPAGRITEWDARAVRRTMAAPGQPKMSRKDIGVKIYCDTSALLRVYEEEHPEEHSAMIEILDRCSRIGSSKYQYGQLFYKMYEAEARRLDAEWNGEDAWASYHSEAAAKWRRAIDDYVNKRWSDRTAYAYYARYGRGCRGKMAGDLLEETGIDGGNGAEDANHIDRACANGVGYFITADRELCTDEGRHDGKRSKIEAALRDRGSDMRIVGPVEFLSLPEFRD